MKILIRHETSASHYVYSGLATVLADEHKVRFWDQATVPAFDAFDAFEPDVFLGQGYNLDRATVKCLNERPEIKIALKVGCWGGVDDDIDLEKFPILMASDEERSKVEEIKSKKLLFNYCHNNRVEYVIGKWTNHGTIWGFLPAADTSVFHPVETRDSLRSDIVFIGGYWGYKAENLDRFFIPLCYPVGKYNVKIFGGNPWPVSQYLGYITDENANVAMCSAKVCPAVHEPHSNEFGFDVLSRVFNAAACKTFTISDYVESFDTDVFRDKQLLMAKSSKEFEELIKIGLSDDEVFKRQYIDDMYTSVMDDHTYEKRATQFLEALNDVY